MERPNGIIVLYNEAPSPDGGNSHETIAEQEGLFCAEAVSRALAPHYQVAQVPLRPDGVLKLAKYSPLEWVVFNLIEDTETRLFESVRIPLALEAMGYCYTGNPAEALASSTNKAVCKKRLQQAGVNVPPGWTFRHPTEVNGKYTFPLFVKPVAKDASLGIDESSIVRNLKALRQRVGQLVQLTQQPALAEGFIAGRELSVGVWGNPPEVLPFSEMIFQYKPNTPESILSFDSKWVPGSRSYENTVGRCPARVSAPLAERLTQTALGVWGTFGCRGYIVLDVRVDENEIPYVVDVNCNPDIAPDAGFFRACRKAGYTYEEMVLRIVELAWATQ